MSRPRGRPASVTVPTVDAHRPSGVSLRLALLAVALVGLLPVIGVTLWLTVSRALDYRHTVADTVLGSVRALSASVDHQLEESIATLETIASDPVLQTQDWPRIHARLTAVARARGWINAILADPSGQQLVNSAVPLPTPLPVAGDREMFQQTLRTRRPAISGLLMEGRVTGRTGLGVAVPVVHGDVVHYVLATGVDPASLRRILVAQQVPTDWRLALIDRGGHVVISTADQDPSIEQPLVPRMAEESRRADEGWFPTVDKEGRAIYAAFHRSPLTGLVVVANVPRAVIDGPVQRALLAMATVALLALAGGALGAVWLARRLAAGVGRIREDATRVGQGETLSSTRPSQIREFQDVHGALLGAAALLAARARERDEADAARTTLLTRERQARAEADLANRAKDEFLAMLSHELRNPLGAIANATAVLSQIGESQHMAIAARAVIERQVQHLTRLVNDLLDVARVTTGKVHLQRHTLDLGALVERTMQTFVAAGRTRGHVPIVTADPVWIHADETRMEQVVSNLVENATKYTPPDGMIRVSVQQDGAWAVLQVSDTGQGISAELLPRVFDLFAQGETSPERARGGLGIGLTLVQRLIELHGGLVTAHSSGAGSGATFTVRLPAIASPVSGDGSVSGPVRAQPRRILLIEDNEDTRNMLQTLLTLDGHRVWTAADGMLGIEAMLTHRPDIILVDVGLPGLDGYEVARRVRALTAPNAPRLIAVTGYGQADDRRRAKEAGFDTHLVKPVDMNALRAAIA